MMAFLPDSWAPPKRVTPKWLADKPLIANDATTLLHRQTAEWFASGGVVPQPRIEMNYTEAMKSLVAAGYGAAILPVEGPSAAAAVVGIQAVPLSPALWRETWIVHRALPMVDGATLKLLTAIRLKERRSRVMCLIAAGLSCIEMPYSTVLGIWTFMVLGRASVRRQFEG